MVQLTTGFSLFRRNVLSSFSQLFDVHIVSCQFCTAECQKSFFVKIGIHKLEIHYQNVFEEKYESVKNISKSYFSEWPHVIDTGL